MSKKITIAIDALGGDNSPDKIIEGVKIFIDKNKDVDDFVINLFGSEDLIKKKLNKYKVSNKNINIFNSNKIVPDDVSPMTAVKIQKTQVWDCIKHQSDNKSDISLSAGNTGVLLVISRMILKMLIK